MNLAMDHYTFNRKIMKVCELTSLLIEERIFDRRIGKISVDIKEDISTIGNLYVLE